MCEGWGVVDDGDEGSDMLAYNIRYAEDQRRPFLIPPFSASFFFSSDLGA